ncbi:MAG: toprim domain-containing protein [Desulfuromonadaceae bacterium]|nr:toprim domain-containing protein [Desulfuromonadaceae bacterium]
MNALEAKKIQISDYLGVDVSHQKNGEIWVKSPFNQGERTASFKINLVKNIWYDHAQGFGGNVLDLVMLLNRCDLSEALKLLENKTNFSFSPASSVPRVEEKPLDIEIKKIQPVQNPALLKYLNERKIVSEVLILKYLKEIYYRQDEKHYFAIAFKNDLGAWEIRNSYFKGCIGSKNITTVKGKDSTKLSVFEGFMDFLSALTYFNKNEFEGDVIILNSTALKHSLDSLNYDKIFLFLDNDETGFKTKAYISEKHKNCFDGSKYYANNKDFNELLCEKF